MKPCLPAQKKDLDADVISNHFANKRDDSKSRSELNMIPLGKTLEPEVNNITLLFTADSTGAISCDKGWAMATFACKLSASKKSSAEKGSVK
jgi:hypothetical protein